MFRSMPIDQPTHEDDDDLNAMPCFEGEVVVRSDDAPAQSEHFAHVSNSEILNTTLMLALGFCTGALEAVGRIDPDSVSLVVSRSTNQKLFVELAAVFDLGSVTARLCGRGESIDAALGMLREDFSKRAIPS